MKKIWKRLAVLLLAAAMFAVLASCGKKPADDDGEKQSDHAGTEDGEHEYYHVEIKIKDYGTIKVELDAICEAVLVTDENGTVRKENQPVIESVKVIDSPGQ